MIYTAEEIERKVSEVFGTHVKKNNVRRKLVVETNNELTHMMNGVEMVIRHMKAAGAKQSELRVVFAVMSKLEDQII